MGVFQKYFLLIYINIFVKFVQSGKKSQQAHRHRLLTETVHQKRIWRSRELALPLVTCVPLAKFPDVPTLQMPHLLMRVTHLHLQSCCRNRKQSTPQARSASQSPLEMGAEHLHVYARSSEEEGDPGKERRCPSPREGGAGSGPHHEEQGRGQVLLVLTAVLLVAAVGTVLEPVALEAADDAVDAAGAREERRAAFGLSLGCRRQNETKSCREEVTLSEPWHTHPASSERAKGSLCVSTEVPQDLLPPPTHSQCRARLRALMQHPQGRGWLCLRYFQGPCTKRGSTPMWGTNK